MNPTPGWWEWEPNTNLGKGPQSDPNPGADFPPWSRRTWPSRHPRTRHRRSPEGLGTSRVAQGGGGTKPTPQTPQVGRGATGKERGRRRISGFSGGISAGNHFVRGEAVAVTMPRPRPHTRAHIRAHICTHGTTTAGNSAGSGAAAAPWAWARALFIVIPPPLTPRQLEQLQRDGGEKGTAAVPARRRGHQTPEGHSPAGLP